MTDHPAHDRVSSLSTFLLIACAALGLASTGNAAPVVIEGRAEVVDGDGLRIGPIAIRIHGIDAPEDGQRCPEQGSGTWDCGTTAANALSRLVEGTDVSCTAKEQDAYGRIVATCEANGQDIADQLVADGLAWAYREYSDDYVEDEQVARAAGVGIWQASGAQTPWDYRANRWERAVADSPDGCPIKGNISSGDERIYHTPWSRWYSRTKINTAKGERWFCDEAEAQAAGWRGAKGR